MSSIVMATVPLTVSQSCNCVRYLPFLLNCFVCFDFVPYSSHHRHFTMIGANGTREGVVGVDGGGGGPSCAPKVHHPQLFVERTLAIIKPDAIHKQKEIEDVIIRSGFSILQRRRILLTPEEASSLYAEHFGKVFFPSLVAYMCSDPVIVFVLARQNAITFWRDLIGPTNTMRARETHPDSLRAIYGTDEQRNGLHGSSDYQSAEREIRFFFHDSIMEPIKLKQSAQDYLAKAVNPTLLKGLTALCKAKPLDPVIWLADWLIDNNPYKPKVKNLATNVKESGN